MCSSSCSCSCSCSCSRGCTRVIVVERFSLLGPTRLVLDLTISNAAGAGSGRFRNSNPAGTGAASGYGENLFSDHRTEHNTSPDETNGVN